jgi:hypothetical protein
VWIDVKTASTLTGLTPPQLRRLIRARRVTSRVIPNTRPKIAASELARLRDDYVRVARPTG